MEIAVIFSVLWGLFCGWALTYFWMRNKAQRRFLHLDIVAGRLRISFAAIRDSVKIIIESIDSQKRLTPEELKVVHRNLDFAMNELKEIKL